jgi:DNA-binding HxlR family transcriptional regulator
MAKSRRPVMRVFDVLGRRWSLRVLWELRDGPLTFRALRDACDEVSPSSLNQRLAELRELGVIEAGDGGYEMTATGRDLAVILLDLHRWAEAQAGPATSVRPLPGGPRRRALTARPRQR